uniref:Uncharacterized protein n=1 Tax=Setaria viridis TaxID=4556 RepID=A0A4U6W064_SETVI|nr:hypothetical protein SEVIR_2G394750v2 [Setaria viridis]
MQRSVRSDTITATASTLHIHSLTTAITPRRRPS